VLEYHAYRRISRQILNQSNPPSGPIMAMRMPARNKRTLARDPDHRLQNGAERELTRDEIRHGAEDEEENMDEEGDENEARAGPSEQRTSAGSTIHGANSDRRRKINELRRQLAESKAEEQQSRQEALNSSTKSFPEPPDGYYSQVPRTGRHTGIPPANPGPRMQNGAGHSDPLEAYGGPPGYERSSNPTHPTASQAAGWPSAGYIPATRHWIDYNPQTAYPSRYYPTPNYSTGSSYPYHHYNGISYPYAAQPQVQSFRANHELHSRPQQPHRTTTALSPLEHKIEKLETTIEDMVRTQQKAALKEKRRKERVQREVEARNKEAELERDKEVLEKEKEAVERQSRAKEMAKMKRQITNTLLRDIGLLLQSGGIDSGTAMRRIGDYGAGGLLDLARQIPRELLFDGTRRTEALLDELAQLLQQRRWQEGQSFIRGGNFGESSDNAFNLTSRPLDGPSVDQTVRSEVKRLVAEYLAWTRPPLEPAAGPNNISTNGVRTTYRNWPAEAEAKLEELESILAEDRRGQWPQHRVSPEPSPLRSRYQSSDYPPFTPASTSRARTRTDQGRAHLSPLLDPTSMERLERVDSGYSSNSTPRRSNFEVDADDNLPRQSARAGPSRHNLGNYPLRAEASYDEFNGIEAVPQRQPAPYAYPEARYPPTSRQVDGSWTWGS
jgi:hypothetical protein